jgi:hypothetical protein
MAWFFRMALLACAGPLLTVLAACGGSGGSNTSVAAAGGAQAGPLTGAWFGAAEDETGQLHSVRLTVAGSRVTSFEVDGADVGGSGPLGQDDAQVFSASLTFPQGQLQVILFADPAGTHFVYLDNFFRFGVLQKDATTLPAYASIDINGTWRGISAFTDFAQYQWDPSSAICIVGVCSVTEVDDRMTESFTGGFDSVYGRWLGTSVINLNAGPQVNKISRAFVSPDKKFAGVWRCLVGADGSVLFPNKCTYSAWGKT